MNGEVGYSSYWFVINNSPVNRDGKRHRNNDRAMFLSILRLSTSLFTALLLIMRILYTVP